MPQIHLVEGPVGSGKSTTSNQLSKRYVAPHFNLDEWMVGLFRNDRPETDVLEWYLERKERCIEQIWRVAMAILDTGCDVILELGLIQKIQRQEFYNRVDTADYKITVYVIDVPKEVRRERVRARNIEKGSTYCMEVTDEVFEIASAMWEEPDDFECSERDVRFL